MFKKIVELIKEALRHFVAYNSVTDTVSSPSVFIVSNEMEHALDLWKDMYQDNSPWLNDSKGVYSLGIAKQVCQSLAMQVLAEMDASIVTPGDCTECAKEEAKNGKPTTRAGFLSSLASKSLYPKLPDVVEKGMALGGVIIKPYFTGQGIFFDFSYQGEFVPLSFDDDGNIIDVAFLDQFIESDKVFTKVERQTFDAVAKTVTVQNKAFVTKNINETTDGSTQRLQLGTEIPLSSIPRWAGIADEPVVIPNVEKPLYGYYKVPLANNIDFDSPMGISVFSPAVNLIKRADMQFSRLDWEFEGGQMAIDIDRNAISPEKGYYGEEYRQDELRERLYRRLDLGIDDTYNVFAPQLRDANYVNGLNRYLSKIEDAIGLARGTLNDDTPVEARTATEVRILKQRTYTTIVTNQEALQAAIEGAIYAADVYANIYGVAPKGKYSVNIEWQDSVLSDTQEELNQRLQLKNAGVLSDIELRMWYTGEDEKTAEAAVKKIKDAAMEEAKAQAELNASLHHDDVNKDTKKTERDNNRDEAHRREQEKKNKEAKDANK